MAGRIRSIKPEWLEDEKLAAMDDVARLLSVSLLLLADDYGRGRAHPNYVAGQVWGYASETDGDAVRKAREGLGKLAASGYVRLYEVGGQRYFEVRNWARHQKVDHPGKPRVPPPDSEAREDLARDSRASRERLAPDQDRDRDLRPGPTTSDLASAPAIPGTTDTWQDASKAPVRTGSDPPIATAPPVLRRRGDDWRPKAPAAKTPAFCRIRDLWALWQPQRMDLAPEKWADAAAEHFGGDEAALEAAVAGWIVAWRAVQEERPLDSRTRLYTLLGGGPDLWDERPPKAGRAPPGPKRRDLIAYAAKHLGPEPPALAVVPKP